MTARRRPPGSAVATTTQTPAGCLPVPSRSCRCCCCFAGSGGAAGVPGAGEEQLPHGPEQGELHLARARAVPPGAAGGRCCAVASRVTGQISEDR